MKTANTMRKTKLAAAISAACSIAATQAYGQAQQPDIEEIMVTGIRGSLQAAMDIKRNSSGVVDAISAEDMGKFPDTNLAESLQRITGVSINRVEGEGSEVTVRGFGGQFNMVTVNGRQMPAANIVGLANSAGSSNSRSFDFSALSSEGVRGLQVYKTGRADVASGGLGATINVSTLRPLEAGNQFSVGAKAVNDRGQSGSVTPELTGLVSWANEAGTFGVAGFASFQERDSAVRTGKHGGWVWQTPFDPTSNTFLGAEMENTPEGDDLAGFAANSRLAFAETNRERRNAMLTLEFAPTDRLRITADAMYATNEMDQFNREDQAWLSRQFDVVQWDGNPIVNIPDTTVETITTDGAGNLDVRFDEFGKDLLLANDDIAVKDELMSLGVNLAYDVTDTLTLSADIATSSAESGGNHPGGWIRHNAAIAGGVVGWQAHDFSNPVPQTLLAITDGEGNQNGVFEKEDVGTQVVQNGKSDQEHDLDQFQFMGDWQVADNVSVNFGVGYLESEMQQQAMSTNDTLGGWGVSTTGDIVERNPDLLTQDCVACEFNDTDFTMGNEANQALMGLVPQEAFDQGVSLMPLGMVGFRTDPRELQRTFDGFVNGAGDVFDFDNQTVNSRSNNLIEEEMFSLFAGTEMDGFIGDMPLNVNAGIRWEKTDVASTTLQTLPQQIIWNSDNDFTTILGDNRQNVSEEHSYRNFLPNLDISLDITDQLKARASFSKTLARPDYGNLFLPVNVGSPDTLTFLGGVASADTGSAQLDPLESDNFDLSLEYYYGESNYASIGYFEKSVSNFIGTAQRQRTFFGLRDVTSGAPGTRSGMAAQALQDRGFAANEQNMFTMTAILDNPQEFPGGADEFDTSSGLAFDVFSRFDVAPNSDDPLLSFTTEQPVNNEDARLNGLEMGWQHFFGQTGFGFQVNATFVDGDVDFDPTADPFGADQFALEGLSDSGNLIVMYENDRFGGRIAYNIRDQFLASTNAGDRVPRVFDEYNQLDFNLNYNITEQLQVTLEGINILEEELFAFGRTEKQVEWIREGDARYMLGVRYSF